MVTTRRVRKKNARRNTTTHGKASTEVTILRVGKKNARLCPACAEKRHRLERLEGNVFLDEALAAPQLEHTYFVYCRHHYVFRPAWFTSWDDIAQRLGEPPVGDSQPIS